LPPNYDPRAAFEAIIREEDDVYGCEGDDEDDSEPETESEDEDEITEDITMEGQEGQAAGTACSTRPFEAEGVVSNC
jgi:hypothetical protein